MVIQVMFIASLDNLFAVLSGVLVIFAVYSTL